MAHEDRYVFTPSEMKLILTHLGEVIDVVGASNMFPKRTVQGDSVYLIYDISGPPQSWVLEKLLKIKEVLDE